MEHRDLDKILKQLAEAPVPPLPGHFAQDVLREIRIRKAAAPAPGGWFADYFSALFRPIFLSASFAIAITVGVAVPVTLRAASETAATTASLGLHVFATSSPNLPSGLLSRLE